MLLIPLALNKIFTSSQRETTNANVKDFSWSPWKRLNRKFCKTCDERSLRQQALEYVDPVNVVTKNSCNGFATEHLIQILEQLLFRGNQYCMCNMCFFSNKGQGQAVPGYDSSKASRTPSRASSQTNLREKDKKESRDGRSQNQRTRRERKTRYKIKLKT